VFQPLTLSYLRSWGGDWKRQAPFPLSYYTVKNPLRNAPRCSILSVVLPDQYKKKHRLPGRPLLVVDKVNLQEGRRLKDLAER